VDGRLRGHDGTSAERTLREEVAPTDPI
jgi:hypothetical protein